MRKKKTGDEIAGKITLFARKTGQFISLREWLDGQENDMKRDFLADFSREMSVFMPFEWHENGCNSETYEYSYV